MSKKNTSVALPGGLAGLVHAAQQPQADNTVSKQPEGRAAAPSAPPAAPDGPAAGTYDAAAYREAIAAGRSRWDLFREMGREYHRASNLGAVYIDRDLKRQLSLLRASSLGLSTSAILSAIVEQFLLEHGEEIGKVLGE